MTETLQITGNAYRGDGIKKGVPWHALFDRGSVAVISAVYRIFA